MSQLHPPDPLKQTPARLVLIRHGESAGNVARDAALAEGRRVVDIAARDCDVPLSALGERQSQALGEWIRERGETPAVVYSSPYVRARQTAELMAQRALWNTAPRCDERLREREFGMLDRLTHSGIQARFPEQVEMRDRLGKFYYRPPGGESWTDVVLRVRSFFAQMQREHAGQSIAIVSHQVVVLCMRYVIEAMNEHQILTIDRQGDVANCSVTSYAADAGSPNGLRLERYNEVTPMKEAGEAVTREPDVPVAPK
ncbi:MAG: histidine phosphatase family protein [Candidatus Baltobacteraceae bacterium]